jgi:mRNA-degrading endonuclease RelE of RelBE toxin-antitoxin system
VRLADARLGRVVKLTDVDPPEWRLRIGDHRAFFRYVPEANEVVVLRVLPRDRAY